MVTISTQFESGTIAPLECIKEGWALIKDRYWLFFGITLVAILVGGAVPIVLLGPMMVGVFLCLFQRQRGQEFEFGTLFKGFDYFVQSLIVAVIKVIPIVVLMVPFYIIMFAVMIASAPHGRTSSPDEAPAFLLPIFGVELLFILVLVVAGIAVEVFFMFAFPLVADRKLSGMDAIKLSLKACKANFGGVLGLLLLNTLFGMVGALGCLVGAYLYLPVSFASYAVAYRRVFPELPESFLSPPPPPPPGHWA